MSPGDSIFKAIDQYFCRASAVGGESAGSTIRVSGNEVLLTQEPYLLLDRSTSLVADHIHSTAIRIQAKHIGYISEYISDHTVRVVLSQFSSIHHLSLEVPSATALPATHAPLSSFVEIAFSKSGTAI